MWTSRGYACALIVHSWAIDFWRTASMAEKEEKARQHFEELKCALPELSLCWWKKNFKSYVDKFIEECLYKKEFITVVPCKDKDEEELDCVYLHGLWHLVAGAIQEWELVQQPKPAATCVELDGALVWQGRGYVRPILYAVSFLHLSFQSEFEKVSPTLWLVKLKPFYKYITFPLVAYSWHKYIANTCIVFKNWEMGIPSEASDHSIWKAATSALYCIRHWLSQSVKVFNTPPGILFLKALTRSIGGVTSYYNQVQENVAHPIFSCHGSMTL